MKWECTCGWMFQPHGLYSHQISVTENMHNFTLDSGKSVLTNVNIEENIQVTKTCSLCGRENLNTRVYEHHIKKHNELEYKCHETNCGWMFENEYGLWYHMEMNHKCTTDTVLAAGVNANGGNFTVKEESLENEKNSNSCEGNENNVDIDKRKLLNESESTECKQHLKFQSFENSNYKEKVETPETENTTNSEQIEGQNEIDSCVITNKRNRDRKARNKVKLSFQIAEDVAAPDKDHVDNEGSEDNSNDSECDYDPKDDDYEPDEEDYDPEEDYDHEDENCDPEDEDYDPEDKNCDPEDKNCDPEDKNCDPEDVDWNSHGEEWSYRETGWNECQLCGRD